MTKASKQKQPTVSTPQYPDVFVQLSGEDGNVYAVIGQVATALRRNCHADAAKQFSQDAFRCSSYDEVLQLVMKTVEVA